jgi:hypothetical protein
MGRFALEGRAHMFPPFPNLTFYFFVSAFFMDESWLSSVCEN